MPSPVNRPLPAFAAGQLIAVATETVVVTSSKVIVDTPQNVVVLHGLVDLSAGTDVTDATFKLRRGSDATGTLITFGNTWGPYAFVATDTFQFVVMGYDDPPTVFGATYVLTVTLTANDTDTTVNAAYLEAIVTART